MPRRYRPSVCRIRRRPRLRSTLGIQRLESRLAFAAQPILVRDVQAAGKSSNPVDFVAIGSMLSFVADDGKVGRELWKTDGTGP
jgi:hypothetical protein